MSYWTDLKYALRLLRKTPFFSAMTMLVLAGGLAVSLYTYGLLNTALYKALPIAGGDRVVRVEGRSGSVLTQTVNAYELSQVTPRLTQLEAVGIVSDTDVELTDRELSQMVPTTYGPSDLFDFTGVKPERGRGFLPGDSVEGAEAVTVISHALWQSAFAGTPDIVGHIVRVNRKPVRIVGVMPDGFGFPIWSRLWLPMPRAQAQPANETASGEVSVYARLAPGASEASATIELGALLADQRRAHPRVNGDAYDYDTLALETFPMSVAGGDAGRVAFAVLNLVAGFIMLLSCVNVGNMLLARTQMRLKEMAVRVAIGAPRRRLLWQMMAESLLICVAGGILALLLVAWWLRATDRFLHAWSDRLPFWTHWGGDVPAVLMTVGVVVFAVFVVAVVPTWRVLGIPCTTLLHDGTRGARSRLSGRLSRVLVTVQVVLIAVVLILGGAMTFVAYRTAHADPGIDGERLLAMDLTAPNTEDSPLRQARYHDRLLGLLRADPTVEAAVLWSVAGNRRFAVDGQSFPLPENYPEATIRVSSDAPVNIAARLVDGRLFDARDNANGSHSALVSKTLADRYWPGVSPVGRSIQLLDHDGKLHERRIVVGVLGDVLDDGQMTQADTRAATAVYVPFDQAPRASTRFLVRYRGDEPAARAALLNLAWQASAGPGVTVDRYTAMRDRTVAMSRNLAGLFVYSGMFALILALTGIYGMCSQDVFGRTQEVGLRRAIGASDASIRKLFLGQGGRRLAIGLGLALAIAGVGLSLLSRLAGLGVVVPVAIGIGVLALISLLVGIATYLSCQQILRGEPAEALRYE